jgi:hypothetical protein
LPSRHWSRVSALPTLPTNNANLLVITGVEGDYDGERVSVADVVRIINEAGLCAIVYTSPSHTEDAPRWRVLCLLSAEHPPGMRDRFLGRLNGVLGGVLSNESWTLSQSFYFGSVKRNPSHRVVVIEGDFIDLRDDLDAGAIRPALREAQTRLREARSTCPAAPRSESLIEKIRARLDLREVLTSHGYARRGNDYRHPNSHSGSFGLNIATFRGIERAFSHNGGDPLHPGNLNGVRLLAGRCVGPKPVSEAWASHLLRPARSNPTKRLHRRAHRPWPMLWWQPGWRKSASALNHGVRALTG